MRDVIWKIVGGVSAINGLVCFALSSIYDISFGKLGFCGHLFYLFVGLIIGWLIVWAKRIRVSEQVQGVVAALMFVVITSISVLLDKLVAGKSDVMSIISYGSFALMSVSMSRKFELGFEAGFSTFFLQLFAAQLFKIKWILLPVALVISSLIIILRHYSESGVQNEDEEMGYGDFKNEKSQDSASGRDAVSVKSLLSRDNEQNNQEESSEAAHDSPSNGQVSEAITVEVNNQQNNEEEETRSSFSVMLQEDQVSSENNKLTIQNGGMHSYAEPELISAEAPGLRRRKQRMTPASIELVLIEARDLVAGNLRGTSNPYVTVHYGNLKKRTKVIYKTLNPKWNQTLEFPDDGSPLLLYVKDHKFVVQNLSIGDCVIEYQMLPPNQMTDKWIPLQGVKRGEIHVQITRKVQEMQKRPSLDAEPSLSHLHQIPTQPTGMRDQFVRGPLPTTNNKENNQEESSQAVMDRSPRDGELSEGSTLLLDSTDQQNTAEKSYDQGQVSSVINHAVELEMRQV